MFDMTGGRGLHALHCELFSESWRDAGLRVRNRNRNRNRKTGNQRLKCEIKCKRRSVEIKCKRRSGIGIKKSSVSVLNSYM